MLDQNDVERQSKKEVVMVLEAAAAEEEDVVLVVATEMHSMVVVMAVDVNQVAIHCCTLVVAEAVAVVEPLRQAADDSLNALIDEY